jgi:hypothetical protein
MKIFQPIVSGSFTTSGSVFLKGLTSAAQSNVVLIDTATGQLYTTASSALGGGGGGTGLNLSQISSGTAVASISEAGGLRVNTDTTITGSLAIEQSLTKYNLVNASAVATWEIFNQATGSYTSAFVKYTVSKGTDSRAGEFITNWNNASVEYTDISTKDIGNTSGVVFTSILEVLDPSKIVIRAAVNTSGWKIKALATFI